MTNPTPSMNLTSLINEAISLGLEICEAPIGAGFLIVKGAERAVVEWINDAPASVAMAQADGPGRLIAMRAVTG